MMDPSVMLQAALRRVANENVLITVENNGLTLIDSSDVYVNAAAITNHKYASSFDVGNQTFRYECVPNSVPLNTFPWTWISPLFLVLLLLCSVMAAFISAMGCYKMRRTRALRGLDREQLLSAESRLGLIENNFKGEVRVASADASPR